MHAQFFSAEPTGEKGERMSWSIWIRKTHRWLAILFTLTVIANFLVRVRGEPPALITYSPLPPLFLLMFSGLYMFLRPYAARKRA